MTWHHQIAVRRADLDRYGELIDWCKQRAPSLRVFGADVEIKGAWHWVFCFDDDRDAERFRAKFSGVRRKWTPSRGA